MDNRDQLIILKDKEIEELRLKLIKQQTMNDVLSEKVIQLTKNLSTKDIKKNDVSFFEVKTVSMMIRDKNNTTNSYTQGQIIAVDSETLEKIRQEYGYDYSNNSFFDKNVTEKKVFFVE